VDVERLKERVGVGGRMGEGGKEKEDRNGPTYQGWDGVFLFLYFTHRPLVCHPFDPSEISEYRIP
jgi:hypothetical protein